MPFARNNGRTCESQTMATAVRALVYPSICRNMLKIHRMLDKVINPDTILSVLLLYTVIGKKIPAHSGQIRPSKGDLGISAQIQQCITGPDRCAMPQLAQHPRARVRSSRVLTKIDRKPHLRAPTMISMFRISSRDSGMNHVLCNLWLLALGCLHMK